MMQANGIRPDQVTQVRGFATTLRKPGPPLDPANRRILVIVQYMLKNNDADEEKSTPANDNSASQKDSHPESNSPGKE